MKIPEQSFLDRRSNGVPVSEYLDRQLLIQFYHPQFGPDILLKKILVVGIGGNGSHLALALTRMGFAEVALVDKDTVSPSNLTRQVLYTKSDVGRLKTDAAADFLRGQSICSEIKVHTMDVLVERQRFLNLVRQADFVFSVVDQLNVTFFVTAACLKAMKPMCSGGTFVVGGFGTTAVMQRPEGQPCLACNLLSKEPPADWIRFYSTFSDDRPEETGELDLSKVAAYDGVIKLPTRDPSTYITASTGSNLMIALMINWMMGNYVNERLIFNLLNFYFDKDLVALNPHCPLCSHENNGE
jgi:molybdopterin/thiamine biosynthesis adenylyltransferase